MSGNKRVYQAAFDRAREGKSRPIWELFLAPFEDTYSRQSRQAGERDGAAARGQPAQ
jgi:hypothetical protein